MLPLGSQTICSLRPSLALAPLVWTLSGSDFKISARPRLANLAPLGGISLGAEFGGHKKPLNWTASGRFQANFARPLSRHIVLVSRRRRRTEPPEPSLAGSIRLEEGKRRRREGVQQVAGPARVSWPPPLSLASNGLLLTCGSSDQPTSESSERQQQQAVVERALKLNAARNSHRWMNDCPVN